MRLPIFILTLSVAIPSIGLAQEQQASAEARLRDALRQMTARVQTAEAEAATAKAQVLDLEAKQKIATAQIQKLTKELADEKDAAQKAETAASTKIAERDAELQRTKESLEKWKAGHAQVSEIAKKAEAARQSFAAKAAALDLRVADLKRKNLSLYQLGNEILSRFEGFAYGTAIAAREPFIGNTRVKLENEVQGYKDKLLDPKLKP